MTTNNVQRPMPDIDEDFKDRVNAIYEEWHKNHLPFSQASKEFERLRQEAIEAGNRLNEAGIYNILGIINGYRSKYENSVIYFDKSRTIYEEEGALRRVATVDLNIGETYRLLGNFSRAKEYFRRAYEEGKALDRVETQVIALTNEGQMWISMDSFDKARESLDEALHLTENEWTTDNEGDAVKRADNLCEIHHAIATVALANSDLEKAWHHATNSYEAAEFSGRILRMGYANRILGNVITQLGKSPDEQFTSNIDYYYDEAISAFKQVKAEGEVAKTLLAHGQSLASRSNKRSAGNKYQQAMVIFTRLGMMDSAAEAAQAQTEII